MYLTLLEQEQRQIDRLLDNMNGHEKIGQTFCIHTHKKSPDEVAELVERYHLGSIFYAYRSIEDTAAITKAADKCSKIPVIANSDLVNGAGSRLENATLFPWQMAVGSADSEELAEKMGIATAREGRAAGVHWTFGPIVDLNLNMLNCMMHTRAFGADPDHVLRISKAFIRGVQKEGLMAATAKHFPGDGTDDRDTHICTLINDLSEKEWFDTFAKVWQGVIDEGVMCIMSGFIGLPWIDPSNHYAGPMPCSLSKKIQIDLLRERLGFKGTIISDAIPMIGFAARAKTYERVPLNIETGGDMVLWPDAKEDMINMERALDSGLLSEERLNTAVRNVLGLKLKLGILDEKTFELPKNAKETHQEWADQIGEKSIDLIRNCDNSIPLKLEPGAKVLTVTVAFDEDTRGYVKNLDTVDEELRKRGYEVIHLEKPGNAALAKVINDFDAVFINIHIMPRYGSTRFFAGSIGALWNAEWVDHPQVVFTSFGDPYKIYEMPYVPNYINTYSNTQSSQKAVVKVWLGEIEPQGHTPVSCKGFFEKKV